MVAGLNGAGKTILARHFTAMSIVTYLGTDTIAENLAAHDPSGMRIEGEPLFSYAIHFDNARPDATLRTLLQVSPHDPMVYGARRLELRRI
jgi:hypothetical protein